ncbi:MAG: ABC transporter permease [Firmicutes bacterium]|nr:ABC transporter permease [Candidatus Caballimonas caccae]
MTKEFSKEHLLYLRGIKRKNTFIWIMRFLILFFILAIWELFARLEIIDSFISSSPSKIVITTKKLIIENNLFYHIGVTLYETILGYVIAVAVGYIMALLIWLNDSFKRIIEPYLVVLNSLPKIAMGPIIIVWFGSGNKSIIFMTFLVAVIVATITMMNGFLETDKEKILLLKSMGATKLQIMLKLVIPGSFPTFISMLKICVGLSWIGSIMGEYLVSRAGLGYLIVYGSQVFKLDLIMASTVILCILASLMYSVVVILERFLIKHN